MLNYIFTIIEPFPWPVLLYACSEAELEETKLLLHKQKQLYFTLYCAAIELPYPFVVPYRPWPKSKPDASKYKLINNWEEFVLSKTDLDI